MASSRTVDENEKRFQQEAGRIAQMLPELLHASTEQVSERQLGVLLAADLTQEMPGAQGVSVGQILQVEPDLPAQHMRRLGAAVVARMESPAALDAFRNFFMSPQTPEQCDDRTLDAVAYELGGMGMEGSLLLFDMLSSGIPEMGEAGRRNIAIAAFEGLGRMARGSDIAESVNAINMVGYTLFNNPDEDVRMRAVEFLSGIYHRNLEEGVIEQNPGHAVIRRGQVSWWVNEYERLGTGHRLPDHIVLHPPTFGTELLWEPTGPGEGAEHLELQHRVRDRLGHLQGFIGRVEEQEK